MGFKYLTLPVQGIIKCYQKSEALQNRKIIESIYTFIQGQECQTVKIRRVTMKYILSLSFHTKPVR